MMLRRVVRHGEVIPSGYGLAWRDFNRDAGVCYPVPLNHIAAFAHDLWLDVRTPTALRDDMWGAGEHSAAFRRGVQAGQQMTLKQFTRPFP